MHRRSGLGKLPARHIKSHQSVFFQDLVDLSDFLSPQVLGCVAMQGLNVRQSLSNTFELLNGARHRCVEGTDGLLLQMQFLLAGHSQHRTSSFSAECLIKKRAISVDLRPVASGMAALMVACLASGSVAPPL